TVSAPLSTMRVVNPRIASIEARTSAIASRPTSGTMIGGCGAMPAKTSEPVLIFHQPAFRAGVNAKKRNNATQPATIDAGRDIPKIFWRNETHFIIENGQGCKTQIGVMGQFEVCCTMIYTLLEQGGL